MVLKSLFAILISFLFISCSSSRLDTSIKYPKIPNNFNLTDDSKQLDEKWLYSLKDELLIDLIKKAIENNYELKKLAYDIKIKEQELVISNSSFFPSIDLSANKSKSGDFDSSDNNAISSNLSLSIQYEVDIWGKLSDSQKSVKMSLLESKALYKEARSQLITDVLILYYEILESNKLLSLYNKNLQISKDNYELTFSRYKQGISEALDAMLAKNSIFTQESKIVNLKKSKLSAIYKLEQLLTDYPKGKLDINKQLPILNTNLNIGIPSDIIERKSSISAAWNALLAKDYELAFTHKQRLPSLSISSSIQNIINDGNPTSWSILAGLTAPIFNAGELKANEQIAFYELKTAELDYLNTLYNSFVEIENYLQEGQNLQKEYQILKKSYQNAKASLELSFNQYLKGLIEYTTVLSLQESFYSTEESLIQMKRSLLENRINLHNALGGDFSPLNIQKENKK